MIGDLTLMRLYNAGEQSALYGSLRFIVAPTLSKIHTITLTMTDSKNSVLTAEQTIVFK